MERDDERDLLRCPPVDPQDVSGRTSPQPLTPDLAPMIRTPNQAPSTAISTSVVVQTTTISDANSTIALLCDETERMDVLSIEKEETNVPSIKKEEQFIESAAESVEKHVDIHSNAKELLSPSSSQGDSSSDRSITPKSTRKPSQSLSGQESASASIYRNIRKAYSLDSSTKERITGKVQFADTSETAESVHPLLNTSPHSLDQVSSRLAYGDHDDGASYGDSDGELGGGQATPLADRTVHFASPAYNLDSEEQIVHMEEEDEQPESLLDISQDLSNISQDFSQTSRDLSQNSRDLEILYNEDEQEENQEEITAAAVYEKCKHTWESNNKSATLLYRPSSSSISFSGPKSSSNSPMKKALFSKPPSQLPAYERLYSSHKNALNKVARKASALLIEKENAETATLVPWQISERSNQLANGHTSQQGDVAERLYSTGLQKKQSRLQKADQMSGVPRYADWSCAKCGTAKKLSADKFYTGRYAAPSDALVVCGVCGYSGQEKPVFHPVNIALEDPATGVDVQEIKARVAARRASSYAADGGEGGLHRHLYEVSKVNPRKYVEVLSMTKERIRRNMPFKPTLPKTSEEIIDALKASATDGYTSDERCKAGAYFAKPPLERLYDDNAPKIRQNHTAGPRVVRPRSSHIPYIFNGGDYGAYKPTTTKTTKAFEVKDAIKVTDAGWESFRKRLIRQEEKKHERIAMKTHELQSVDWRTGQELWKPRIPEPLEIEGKVLGVAAPASSFELILAKEKHRKARLDAACRRKAMEELELQAKSKVVMNATSAAIVDESTERGLEEIFKVLLASVERPYTSEFDLNRAFEVTRRASEMADWSERELDVSLVRQEMLIANVMELVVEAFRLHFQAGKDRERSMSQVTLGSELDDAEETSVSIGYSRFRELMHAAIKRRRSLGLHYAVSARRRDQLGRELNFRRQEEATFVPDTSLSQAAVSVRRPSVAATHRSASVADTLMENGERLKARIDAERSFSCDQRMRETYSFKPTLFKPPSYVKPRYRGVLTSSNNSQLSTSSSWTTIPQVVEVEEPLSSTSDMIHPDAEVGSNSRRTSIGVLKLSADEMFDFREDSVVRMSAANVMSLDSLDRFDDLSVFTDDHEGGGEFGGLGDIGGIGLIGVMGVAGGGVAMSRSGSSDDTNVLVEPTLTHTYADTYASQSTHRPKDLLILIPSDDTDDRTDSVTEVMSVLRADAPASVQNGRVVAPLSARSVHYDEINLVSTGQTSPRRRNAVHSHDRFETEEDFLPRSATPSVRVTKTPSFFSSESDTSFDSTEVKQASVPAMSVENSPVITTRNMKLTALVRELRK